MIRSDFLKRAFSSGTGIDTVTICNSVRDILGYIDLSRLNFFLDKSVLIAADSV
jgi:hypothetical protein